MYEDLFENLVSRNNLEEVLCSIKEQKQMTWEQVAHALYQILDDIDTASDICKENTEAFQNMVMKLQAKRNELMASYDGYTVEPVVQILERYKRIETDKVARISNESEFTPVATLMDEYGGKAQIGIDDHCYVLYLKETDSEFYKPITHIWKEAFEVLKDLPELNESQVVEPMDLKILQRDKLAQIDYGNPYHLLTPEQKEIISQKMRKDESRRKNGLKKLEESLTDFARYELQAAGLFDKDSDYEGMIGEAVMDLISKFAEQGHSGFSASITREIFDKLSNYKPLSELTDNLDEWNDISEAQAGKPGWQSSRCPSAFSEDGGKTYWDIDEDYYKYTDEDGTVWSGGLTEEQWANRPMHTSKPWKVQENGQYKGPSELDQLKNSIAKSIYKKPFVQCSEKQKLKILDNMRKKGYKIEGGSI